MYQNNQYQNIPYTYQSTPQPVYQQYQQPPQAPVSIFGKFINSEADITPNEVPMNGSPGIFPTRDYSCIYVKSWGNNGSINTVKFVPQIELKNETSDTASTEDFNKTIMARLDKIESLLTKPKPNYHKKETVNDD